MYYISSTEGQLGVHQGIADRMDFPGGFPHFFAKVLVLWIWHFSSSCTCVDFIQRKTCVIFEKFVRNSYSFILALLHLIIFAGTLVSPISPSTLNNVKNHQN